MSKRGVIIYDDPAIDGYRGALSINGEPVSPPPPPPPPANGDLYRQFPGIALKRKFYIHAGIRKFPTT